MGTPEELRGNVEAIRTAQAWLEKRKQDFLKDLAREEGRLADTLPELFPKQNPVWEIKKKRDPQIFYSRIDPEGELEAYYCLLCRGWIKGMPREEKFDVGTFYGAAGKRFFCTVCEQQVGLIVTERRG